MFRKQVNDYTCSPVLLYNIGIWLDQPKDLGSLMYQCKTDLSGTYDEDFERLLYQLWVGHMKISQYSCMNPTEFLSHPNTAIALGHREIWEKDYGDEHHSFWFAPTFAINLKPNELFSKDENIELIIKNTNAYTDTPATIYYLEKL